MPMSNATKLFTGISLLIVPTIEFGGTFLLRILSGGFPSGQFTQFQKDMFRAGHAHAGVLAILCILAQILTDEAKLPEQIAWAVRIGFLIAPILISGGFFGGAAGKESPGGLIALLWAGVVVLALALIALGVGMLRARV